MEERAQYDAGHADGLGHTINTSVAAGLDGVPAELLSWARHKDYDPTDDASDGGFTVGMRMAYCRVMAAIFNGMLQTGTVPPNFTEAVVTLLKKEAKAGEVLDFSLFGSYRPISCIDTMHKVLKLVLVRRLSHLCSATGLLGGQQAGFSHRLATEHNIVVLLEAIRRRMDVPGSKTYALFVDVKRAYDSVPHNGILKVLETVGVAPSMCSLIKALLADATFRLDINGGLSEPIPLKVGLPQGDPLSPILFLLYIESLCKALDDVDTDLELPTPLTRANSSNPPPVTPRRRGLMTVGQLLRDLLYADDVAVLAATFADLVRVRAIMEEWGAAWGLEFNPKLGKTEYILFNLAAQQGFSPPDIYILLTSGSKKHTERIARVVPPRPNPIDAPPIPHGNSPGWGAAPLYRYLGVDFTSVLDFTAHWDRTIRGTLQRFNITMYHRSSLLGLLTTARRLQLRKIFLQPYAWSCLPVPAAVKLYWDQFLHKTGCAALHISVKNASILHTACLMGSLSADAQHLREELRLTLQGRAHPSLLAPADFPRHASVDFLAALDAEDHSHMQLGTDPPPNRSTEVRKHYERATGWLTHQPPFHSLRVPWSFQIRDYLRPLAVGVTYFAARKDHGVIPAPFRRMGPDLPRMDGPDRAALTMTFGLSANSDSFRPGARPLSLSILGPGCPHIISLATEVQSQEVINASRGNSCFRLPPWVGVDGDGVSLATPVPSGTDPLPANWNSRFGCAFCGRTHSLPHLFGDCPHTPIAAVRREVATDALTKFLPSVVKGLRRLRLQPADSGPPLDDGLGDLEKAALDSLGSIPLNGELSNELQHIMFRLVTAAPWPRRVVQPGHHLASGLGALFDSVIASPQSVRRLANSWVRWAKIAITKMAKARWQALLSEARAPSLPRPPKWTRSSTEEDDAPLMLDDLDPPPIYGKQLPSLASTVGGNGRIMTLEWFKKCDRTSLSVIYDAACRHPPFKAKLRPDSGRSKSLSKLGLAQALYLLDLSSTTVTKLAADLCIAN
jgi:hypothetical protein